MNIFLAVSSVGPPLSVQLFFFLGLGLQWNTSLCVCRFKKTTSLQGFSPELHGRIFDGVRVCILKKFEGQLFIVILQSSLLWLGSFFLSRGNISFQFYEPQSGKPFYPSIRLSPCPV